MAGLIDFLEDLSEKFFRCNICLDQLRQPTQLPCLHRFCRECLKQSFSVANSEPAKCPVCRDPFAKATVDDLKRDFFTEQLIEFCTERRRSVKHDIIRKCLGCCLEERAHSYCFKCNGFLCQECSGSHSEGYPRDHFISMLNIQTFLQITREGIDILVRLSQSCRLTHSEKVVKPLCYACQHLGVCGGYVRGDHVTKGENIEHITSSAYSHLNKKVDYLEGQMKVNLQKVLNEKTFHKDVQRRVEGIINELKMTSLDQSGWHIDKTRQSALTTDERFEDIIAQREAVITYLKNVVKAKRRHIAKLDCLEKSWQMRCNKLKEAATCFSSARDGCQFSFVFGVRLFCDIIDDIVSQGTSCLSMTGYPSINLMFSPSKNKGCFGVLRLSSSLEFCAELSADHIDSKVHVCSVTSSSDGRLFVSGYTNDGLSLIVQTSLQGRELHRKEFQGTPKKPRRVVAFYKDELVVTACQQDELGIFNSLDGTYYKENIRKLVSNWSINHWVTCVAADGALGVIIVGSVQWESGDVEGTVSLEIFNSSLEYIRTVQIPYAKGTIDICLLNGVIVVCDLWGKNVFTIDMNGRLLHGFAGPRVNGLQCAPRSVCMDSAGYIYVLWECNVDESLHKLVMQSTIEGRPLTLQKVDSDTKSITVAKFKNGEPKLVAVTFRSRRVHVYSIMHNDEQDFHNICL